MTCAEYLEFQAASSFAECIIWGTLSAVALLALVIVFRKKWKDDNFETSFKMYGSVLAATLLFVFFATLHTAYHPISSGNATAYCGQVRPVDHDG